MYILYLQGALENDLHLQNSLVLLIRALRNDDEWEAVRCVLLRMYNKSYIHSVVVHLQFTKSTRIRNVTCEISNVECVHPHYHM